MAAAQVAIIVATRDTEEPWALEESVRDEFLPERRPAGRSEWRNANYALHAAACLAAGVWLDVGRQESFWNLPLWPFALDAVELLTQVAAAPSCSLPQATLQARLLDRLVRPSLA